MTSEVSFWYLTENTLALMKHNKDNLRQTSSGSQSTQKPFKSIKKKLGSRTDMLGISYTTRYPCHSSLWHSYLIALTQYAYGKRYGKS
ncbi:hypothetical protein Glove_242g77 [Diversispora epigaea]|uniref:Uncharacterized protein n=1 Tax=Diversispora epigaea TaxID=1348612 RepID=A0A397IIV3_9GLOM|nr:hypothetical protein Glove_242g77 [Diversispora epigaea]